MHLKQTGFTEELSRTFWLKLYAQVASGAGGCCAVQQGLSATPQATLVDQREQRISGPLRIDVLFVILSGSMVTWSACYT